MKITIISILFACLCSIGAFAQSKFAIKGLVADSSAKTNIDQATVSIIGARDSMLVTFAYADKGKFNIEGLASGKYLLLVTFPDYADFTDAFTLDDANPVKDFGKIYLILRTKLLNEVMVKSKIVPMTINGDTTTFNAAAYAVQKNARADDILKQLPGMRIDREGKIIFQGDEVQKVLIDGEETFSTDPSLVSRNLFAERIAKIQVFDDRTEQAKRTGIADGKKVKTINYIIREDKKRGLEGSLDAAKGNERFYQLSGSGTKFAPKRALYLSGNTSTMPDGSSDGLPSQRNINANYRGPIRDSSKHVLSGNVSTGTSGAMRAANTITQNNLPGNFNINTSDVTERNNGTSHSVSASLNSTLGKDQLYINLNAQRSNGFFMSENTSNTVRGNNIRLNSNYTTANQTSNGNVLSAALSYSKPIKAIGANVSVGADHYKYRSDNDEYQYSDVKYYNAQGDSTGNKIIDQYKPSRSKIAVTNATFNIGGTYFKTLISSISYRLGQQITDDSGLAYAKSAQGRYDLLDSSVSNDLQNRVLSHRLEFFSQYTYKKHELKLTVEMVNSGLKQTDKLFNVVLTRDYTNWRPSVFYTYSIKKDQTIQLELTRKTEQPSLYQLQPYRQNYDPLNIYLPNPDLKPEYSNFVFSFYRLYMPSIDAGVNLKGWYNHKFNALVNNRNIDSAGITTNRWSNLTDRQADSWYFYSEVYFHATKLKFLVSPSLTINSSTSYNMVNGQLNETENIVFRPGIRINKGSATYYYDLGFAANIYRNKTSLQNLQNNTRNYNAYLNLYTRLPYQFFIGEDANYDYNSANQVFDRDFKQLLLKAYFGKLFGKEENLKLTLTGNDLLDQNRGYSRFGNTDSFTESRKLTIRRFFALSLTWTFKQYRKTSEPATP